MSLPDTLAIEDLNNKVDFCLLFAVVHEVNKPKLLFEEIYNALKPGSKVLFAEPRGHVSDTKWKNSLLMAEEIGFGVKEASKIKGSHSAILTKTL